LRGKVIIKNDSVYPQDFGLMTDMTHPYLDDNLSKITSIFKENLKDK